LNPYDTLPTQGHYHCRLPTATQITTCVKCSATPSSDALGHDFVFAILSSRVFGGSNLISILRTPGHCLDTVVLLPENFFWD
jgi:hypothetical protein